MTFQYLASAISWSILGYLFGLISYPYLNRRNNRRGD